MSEPLIIPIPGTNTVLEFTGTDPGLDATSAIRSALDPSIRAMVNEIRPLGLSLDEAIAAVSAPAPAVLPVTVWAARKKTHPVFLRAAIVTSHWQVGEEFDPCLVTEEAFDKAISFVMQ